MLSALLQQLKHSWDEQRGPTAPPLQLLFAPEVGELVIAEAANLIALLQEQLVSVVAVQPDRQQLQLKTAIQRSSGATELVFTLIGPPDLDLLRMALPG